MAIALRFHYSSDGCENAPLCDVNAIKVNALVRLQSTTTPRQIYLKPMAKDKLHNIVEAALLKDGWLNIKSIALDYDGTDLNIDIIADKLISAEKGNLQIAVEVKSFGNPSVTYDFHQAVGQYLHYRMALDRLGIQRTPYLAVPEAIYANYLNQLFFRDGLSLHRVNLVTVNVVSQEIAQWNPLPQP
jgi:XisH protein